MFGLDPRTAAAKDPKRGTPDVLGGLVSANLAEGSEMASAEEGVALAKVKSVTP